HVGAGRDVRREDGGDGHAVGAGGDGLGSTAAGERAAGAAARRDERDGDAGERVAVVIGDQGPQGRRERRAHPRRLRAGPAGDDDAGRGPRRVEGRRRDFGQAGGGGVQRVTGPRFVDGQVVERDHAIAVGRAQDGAAQLGARRAGPGGDGQGNADTRERVVAAVLD